MLIWACTFEQHFDESFLHGKESNFTKPLQQHKVSANDAHRSCTLVDSHSHHSVPQPVKAQTPGLYKAATRLQKVVALSAFDNRYPSCYINQSARDLTIYPSTYPGGGSQNFVSVDRK